MRIALFGATGMVGSRIAAEAVSRGHEVTGFSRSGGELPGVSGEVLTVENPSDVARAVVGHDVVASALAPPRDGTPPTAPFLAANETLVEGLRAADMRRLVVVGGAGTLEVAPGERLVDTPDFPKDYKPEALAHGEVLDYYRTVGDLDWTYISPAPKIGPGQRTGEYRQGADQVIGDSISAEDYAIAFVDELEDGAHPHTRISVAN
ncbi:NAD(P)H-binding protein [Actinocorallia lasiicapitis]